VSAERIGVVGAGLMGAEIAQVAAAAGAAVVLNDASGEMLERGIERIRRIGERRVARGRWTAAQAEEVLARIAPADDLPALAGCGLVIEAITEVLEVKQDLMRRLDALLGPDAIIASNTSGLSITELGRATGRPDRVVGLHFFNPASVMRLVEVVRGEDTSDATADAAAAVAERMGKTPVRVRECPGFLVNRILVRALVEAYRHAGEIGAGRAAADAAVVEAGPAPMGPFALGDLVGLDTLLHVQRGLVEAYGERFTDGGLVEAEVARGRLGAKSGAGLLEGEAPDDAAPDAPGREVAGRYYAGARDEARRCLDEGVVDDPGDVTTALTLGAGWSAGPLEPEA